MYTIYKHQLPHVYIYVHVHVYIYYITCLFIYIRARPPKRAGAFSYSHITKPSVTGYFIWLFYSVMVMVDMLLYILYKVV